MDTCEEGAKSYGSVPLLDMLAEVASATLKNDPLLTADTLPKASRRSFLQSNVLTLDEIRVLSDRMLLEMFSEMTSNEMKKTFSYKCFLMPNSCSQTFSSFGSETKARLQMKSHLLSHVAELLAEANAPGKSSKPMFTAEPINVRKKRLKLQEDGTKRRKRTRCQGAAIKNHRLTKVQDKVATKQKVKSSVKVKTEYTKLKPMNHEKESAPKTNGSKISRKGSALHSSSSSSPEDAFLFKPFGSLSSSLTEIKNEDDSSLEQAHSFGIANGISDLGCISNNFAVKSEEPQVRIEKGEKKKPGQIVCKKIYNGSTYGVQLKLKMQQQKKSLKMGDNVTKPKSSSNKKLSGRQAKVKNDFKAGTDEEKVNSLKELEDNTEQPQHDHSYTSSVGKKKGIERLHMDNSSSDEMDEWCSDDPKKQVEHPEERIIATPSFPYVYIPLLPNTSEVIEIDSLGNKDKGRCLKPTPASCSSPIPEVKDEDEEEEEEEDGVLSPTRSESNDLEARSIPGTTKPKQTRVRHVVKVIVPEEYESDSEEETENHGYMKNESSHSEEDYQPADVSPKKPQNVKRRPSSKSSESSTDLERKLALKYIRALHSKRKEDRGPLVCKICKTKTFTAQATLMYHYRSHAGIKPFNCKICEATFTRQHSLNYHMLIHNNKSRFVCEDCGRNFRHPSHYKEHLRRHTGETPYECGDCGQRFKTRNTYKRHLKTRHSKILTAQGIVTLSADQYPEAKTSLLRKALKQNSLRKKDKETQWPEVSGFLRSVESAPMSVECIM